MNVPIILSLDRCQLDLLREMHELAEASLNVSPLLVRMLGVDSSMDYNKTRKDYNQLMQDIILQAKTQNQIKIKDPGKRNKLIIKALEIAIKQSSEAGNYSQAENFLNLKNQYHD